MRVTRLTLRCMKFSRNQCYYRLFQEARSLVAEGMNIFTKFLGRIKCTILKIFAFYQPNQLLVFHKPLNVKGRIDGKLKLSSSKTILEDRLKTKIVNLSI